MARARNIKPGFFTNDSLAECDPFARLLFAGLWTIADRAGRLEDRPKRIKAALLPYDECDVEELLNQLCVHGFIVRYEVGGQRLIQVLAFDKHQNPHKNEPESTLPAFYQAPEQHSTSTVQAPEQHSSNRADSLNLIPDSINTSPEGDVAEPDEQVQPTAGANGVQTSQQLDQCPHNDIIAIYHEKLPMGTMVRSWTPARQKALRARWREDKSRQNLRWWADFFEYVGQSDFLTGRTASHGRAPFVVSLSWLCNAENFAKVIEGNFENRERIAA